MSEVGPILSAEDQLRSQLVETFESEAPEIEQLIETMLPGLVQSKGNSGLVALDLASFVDHHFGNPDPLDSQTRAQYVRDFIEIESAKNI